MCFSKLSRNVHLAPQQEELFIWKRLSDRNRVEGELSGRLPPFWFQQVPRQEIIININSKSASQSVASIIWTQSKDWDSSNKEDLHEIKTIALWVLLKAGHAWSGHTQCPWSISCRWWKEKQLEEWTRAAHKWTCKPEHDWHYYSILHEDSQWVRYLKYSVIGHRIS